MNPHFVGTRFPRLKAFTLTELLVTIGILCLLVALLVPTLNRAMEGSKEADCANNLRQIGAAFFLYLPDHNNTMPQRVYDGAVTEKGVRLGYDELLAPYVGDALRLFQCRVHNPKNYPAEPSYGMNWYYDNANVNLVENRGGTILLAETLGISGTGSHRADRDSSTPGELDSERHRDRANYLFFDGHVEKLAFDDTLDPEDKWGEDQCLHDMPPPEI